MRSLDNYRKQILFLIDMLITICSCIFVFGILSNNFFELDNIIFHCFIFVASVSLTRFFFRVYGNIWRYAETGEYMSLMVADGLGCLLGIAAERLIFSDAIPLVYALLTYMISLSLVLFSRFIYKKIRYEMHNKSLNNLNAEDQNLIIVPPVYVAIVGAGYAGTFLVNQMKNGSGFIPYCFFDNDPTKIGKFIHGIPVKGKVESIPDILKGTPVSQIFIAIPSITGDALENIFGSCSKTSCKIKIYEYPMTRIEKSQNINLKTQLRDINIEDLLSREPIRLDLDNVKSYIHNKTILVTGGGGSIGSELCSQIATLAPSQLIILDIYENNVYEIQQELLRNFGNELNLSVEIASVRDEKKVNIIFSKYKPDVVFHAAAHKHVPLMEDCPDEAIKNNVFGTYNIVMAAEKWGVKKMVMISTDKAVNPTNVMGATKRMCEMIIQSMKNSKTEYVAVRFGNVLGSNGSVIPLFKKQIEKGGPVTITDKRIIRYFMTIPEAVQLVLQTGVMAVKSEIFVLDMGAPVKIYDLAINLIKLSGLVPNVDIKIEEIGLRPGEKLYEELLVNANEMTRTDNEKIFIEHTQENKLITTEEIDIKLEILKKALATNNNDIIKKAMMKIIPTYKSPDDVNAKYFQIESLEDSVKETDLKEIKAVV